jgi:alanine racemase
MSERLFSLHPTQALISISAFRRNLESVRAYVGNGVKIMAVVKANAYGHGAIELSMESSRLGAEYLGVARLEEALELRDAGITNSILVFEITPAPRFEIAILENLDLTLSTLSEAERLNDGAARLQRKARVHIKVDTGMGRVGVPFHSAAASIETIARMKWLEVVGIYSHFATSEEPDQRFAREQLGRFGTVLDELEHRRIDIPLKHMSNSGAILSLPESHFNMVRPGIMLYGYAPRKSMSLKYPLMPVMSLVSTIALVKTVDAGTSISYGRRYYTPEKTKIATVPIGYADGYSRLLTGKAEVVIRGKRLPVVGTICMDHLMVDLRDDTAIEAGETVTLMGMEGEESISAWDIAEKLGTIPYEVTSLITPRVARVIVQ